MNRSPVNSTKKGGAKDALLESDIRNKILVGTIQAICNREGWLCDARCESAADRAPSLAGLKRGSGSQTLALLFLPTARAKYSVVSFPQASFTTHPMALRSRGNAWIAPGVSTSRNRKRVRAWSQEGGESEGANGSQYVTDLSRTVSHEVALAEWVMGGRSTPVRPLRVRSFPANPSGFARRVFNPSCFCLCVSMSGTRTLHPGMTMKKTLVKRIVMKPASTEVT